MYMVDHDVAGMMMIAFINFNSCLVLLIEVPNLIYCCRRWTRHPGKKVQLAVFPEICL